MNNENIITNRSNGELASVVGREAVEAFRLRVIIRALEFREKTGFEVCRIPSLRAAKRVTGLKTNNRPKHIAALTELLHAAIARCEVVTV